MTARRTAIRARAGFTLIEVMVSLGVMTVGAMAILALQQHSIRSNAHARQLTTAMQIAQVWSERLKQDAATWNTVAVETGSPSATEALANTRYLIGITNRINEFQTIPGITSTSLVSNAFDYQGNEIPNTPSSGIYPFYCASVRFGWVWFGRAMRADVRVWWPRSESANTHDILTDFPGCADDGAALSPTGPAYNNYHVVYLPTVIRMNTVDN